MRQLSTLLFAALLGGVNGNAQRIVPIAHCAEVSPKAPPAGRAFPVFIAHFGYLSSGDTSVSLNRAEIIAGLANNVFPGTAAPYGMPGVLEPGYHPFAFGALANGSTIVTSFPGLANTDTMTWTLASHSATVSIAASTTAPAPTPAPLTVCPVMAFPQPALMATVQGTQRVSVAVIKGDFSYKDTAVRDVRIVGGGNGVFAVANPAYTQSSYTYDPTLDSSAYIFGRYVPGQLVADLTFAGAMAASGTLQFTITGAGLVPQTLSVPVSYTPSGDGCASNVSSQTTVTLSGLTQNIMTKVWTQTARLQNIGSSTIPGPIRLALDSLSASAVLTNAAGTTSCAGPSSPYVALAGDLATGQTAAFSLSFTNSVPSQAITFAPRVLSGGTGQ